MQEKVRGKIGKPVYGSGDVVLFKMPQVRDWDGNVILEAGEIEGVVEIVDAFGTFEQNFEPSYDILAVLNGEKTLVKHIPESEVIKKIRRAEAEERL